MAASASRLHSASSSSAMVLRMLSGRFFISSTKRASTPWVSSRLSVTTSSPTCDAFEPDCLAVTSARSP